MKFYFAPNTISIAVAILLEELGLDYEPVKLDFASGEQTKPDYHKINPKGRVPALVTDDGILTETGAILEYLTARAENTDFLMADPWDMAQMRSVMFYLASTMHVNHAHKMRGHRWANHESSWQDMTSKVPETMTASCAFIEEDCLKTPFLMGDQFTLADPYLFIVCNWASGDGVDLTPFPKIRAFLATMEARPSVKAVRERGWLT